MGSIVPIQQEELLILVLKEKLPDLSRVKDSQVVSRVGKERFEEGATSVFSYLDTSCGTNLSRLEQTALLSQVVKCLMSYMKNAMGLPVTLKTIFDCIHLLPHAVDCSFPGYAEAGVLRAIVSPTRLSMVQLQKAS